MVSPASTLANCQITSTPRPLSEQQYRLQQIATHYSRQIDDISQREFANPFIQSIHSIFTFIFENPTNDPENCRAQLTVEDMSIGELSGCYFEYALNETKRLLSLIRPTQPKLESALSYAADIEDKLQNPLIPHKAIVEKVIEKVANLSIQETICLPVSNSEHAMLLSITCTKLDKNGKKIFSLSLYNTGDGLEHHYQKIDKSGNVRFQTDYTIEQISEQALCGTDSCFFDSLLSSPTISDLYTTILPSIPGKKSKRNLDLRHWNHEQIGDSCSSSCIRVMLRSQMSSDDYKLFRLISRIELLLASYRGIVTGTNDGPTQKRITLEMIHRLKRSCIKQQIQPSLGLDLMKQKIIASEEKLVISTTHPSTLSFLHNIQQAKDLLTQYSVDEIFLEKASAHIIEALQKKQHRVSAKEREALQTEANTIRHAFEEIPMTERQRYLMTGLEAIIQRALPHAGARRKKSETSTFFQNIRSKYHSLKLDQKSEREGYAISGLHSVIMSCQ